jgi:hypothetical protein
MLTKNTIGQYKDCTGRFLVTLRYDRLGHKVGYVVYDLSARKHYRVQTLREASECVRRKRA